MNFQASKHENKLMGKAEYNSLIEQGRTFAKDNQLSWNLPLNEDGKVPKALRWNLSRIISAPEPPIFWLSTARIPPSAEQALRKICAANLTHTLPSRLFLTEEWWDLYKAIALHTLLVRKNKLPHVNVNILKIVRILGVCCFPNAPWEVSPEDIRKAYNVSLLIGKSGKTALNMEMVVRLFFDGMHLPVSMPLSQYCRPFSTYQSQQRNVDARRSSERTFRRTELVRTKLSDRKSPDRLPDKQAFWELVDIVFTEQPKTISDFIRFRIIQLCIITGLRIGEVVMLPADCLRKRSYATKDGNPAATEHGISTSLTLRYFSEKNVAQHRKSSLVLTENTQHVPPMFSEIVEEIIASTLRVTLPMRVRLKQQTNQRVLFPELAGVKYIPSYEAYARVTGNIAITRRRLASNFLEEYRKEYSPIVLDKVYQTQVRDIEDNKCALSPQIRSFHHQWKKYVDAFDCEGRKIEGKIRWKDVYFKVSQIEAFLNEFRLKKKPDTLHAKLQNGKLHFPYQNLFLLPVYAQSESRQGGIADLNRYYSVGKASTHDIMRMLDGTANESIFARYRPQIAKQLFLRTHSFRHLQSTELLRLNVADTVISKRFRKDVRHAAAYDHRSLAEDLNNIAVEDEILSQLSERGQTIYQLVKTGTVAGPIVDEFRQVEATEGIGAAIQYLQSEADGFHVTPYGVCLNAFTVDTCPNHLECFNHCRHLARTNNPSEQKRLLDLRDHLAGWIKKLQEQPDSKRPFGWQNQLSHASQRLGAVQAALETKPDGKVFPEGKDRYQNLSNTKKSILD
ncbi:hypothetical protein [Thalassospira sp. A3_1]|uniref:hypothetical protein n=1 Tax=Thalassospira sp. A3_1 TaxID=2821088 RepID=UPI001ADA0B8A|nr:hypothetical protein [Thalassospira sp. A3_1]MBO9508791.1 hypothetical protein [Thalassospira sp. A3_1]